MSTANALENCQVNGQFQIKIILGDSSKLPPIQVDLILANINLNILLSDMPVYYSLLKDQGRILFSGLYNHDFQVLRAEAQQCGLTFEKKWEKNTWIAASFLK